MKEIKYTILNFVLCICEYSGTVINYGSGSNFLTSYGSGSTRQKVPVPVPQHWFIDWHIGTQLPRAHTAPAAAFLLHHAKIVLAKAQ
jgi:hypothetical protein